MMKAKIITGSETMNAPALIVSHSIPCEVRKLGRATGAVDVLPMVSDGSGSRRPRQRLLQ